MYVISQIVRQEFAIISTLKKNGNFDVARDDSNAPTFLFLQSI